MYGRIFVDGEQIGSLQILAHLDAQRGLVVTLGVAGGLGDQQVSGRAQLYPVLEAALSPYLARSDVDRIEGPFLNADTAEAVQHLPDAREPEPGSRRWYRRQDVDTRQADPRHPSTLAQALLRASDPEDVGRAFVEQLADDLSGRYGPYLITFLNPLAGPRDGIELYGAISRDGEPVGGLRILAHLDPQRRPVVTLGVDGADGSPIPDRAQLHSVLETTLGPYLAHSGADRIDGPILAANSPQAVQRLSDAGERDRSADAVERDTIRKLTQLLQQMQTVPGFAEGARTAREHRGVVGTG